MPPRKKLRLSARSTPLREGAQSKTSRPTLTIEKPEPSPAVDPPIVSPHDPWTDEEETLLFKSIVRWKPTGMHKHFRMIAIFETFRSNGFLTAKTDPPAHLLYSGLWKKLKTLYDLEALDQREDMHAGLLPDSDDDEEEREQWFDEFELPFQEFGDIMFRRALKAEETEEKSDSESAIPGLNQTAWTKGAGLEAINNEGAADDDQEDEHDDDQEENNDEDDDDNDDEEAEDEQEEETEPEKKPKVTRSSGRGGRRGGARSRGRSRGRRGGG